MLREAQADSRWARGHLGGRLRIGPWAEDEPSRPALTRGAIKMLLEWEGYQVDCAANGQEALDYLHGQGEPELILLDVMMPVLDGEEFRREQQRDPSLAKIPVVVVSALEAASCPCYHSLRGKFDRLLQ